MEPCLPRPVFPPQRQNCLLQCFSVCDLGPAVPTQPASPGTRDLGLEQELATPLSLRSENHWLRDQNFPAPNSLWSLAASSALPHCCRQLPVPSGPMLHWYSALVSGYRCEQALSLSLSLSLSLNTVNLFKFLSSILGSQVFYCWILLHLHENPVSMPCYLI